MECSIRALDGRVWSLPELFMWEISHGFGSPCDSFEIEFLPAAETWSVLEQAVYFNAQSGGETVFCGIIDEFELSATLSGTAVTLRGRGLQARLLDNETESAQHNMLSLGTLLDTYVRPFGISKIEMGEAANARGNLTVDSGSSCWSALSEFCRFHAGTEPRFASDGTLVIDGEKGGKSLEVNGKTPFTAMHLREDRYGVISSAIVKNKVRGTKTEMQNTQYAEKGLSSRRVITVPRTVGYDAMRHTGTYQIACSARDMHTAEITLPWEFAAFPGDRVTIKDLPLSAPGEFIVTESRCCGSSRGIETRLGMRRVH